MGYGLHDLVLFRWPRAEAFGAHPRRLRVCARKPQEVAYRPLPRGRQIDRATFKFIDTIGNAAVVYREWQQC